MNISTVDLRQLRYFVCVAEELHFGKAAKRLNMSQPPLSQQIKALEYYLGVTLFYRTKRHVELTAAGRYLLPEARRVLDNVSNIVEQTKHVEAGLTGHLKIGMNFSAPFHPMTSKLLSKYHDLYPNVKVELVLHEQENILQLADITNENLDVALIWLDEGHQAEDIIRVNLATDPMQATVSSSHKLAKKERIHIRDLVDEPFIAQPRHAGTQRYDGIMKAYLSIDSFPNIVYETLQMPLVMSMVAAGQGVSLLPSFLSKVSMAGIAFRPLITPKGKPPTMTYNLIGSKSNRNSAAKNFFDLAQKMIKK